MPAIRTRKPRCWNSFWAPKRLFMTASGARRDRLGWVGTSRGFAPAHEDDRDRSHQLARFAGQLKQLNRLSTTRYDALEQAFEDHLKTGCQVFGLPIGV